MDWPISYPVKQLRNNLEHYPVGQHHQRLPRMNSGYENRILNESGHRNTWQNNFSNMSSSLCSETQLTRIQDPLTQKFSNSIQEFYYIHKRFNNSKQIFEYNHRSVIPQTYQRKQVVQHQFYNDNIGEADNNSNQHYFVYPNNQALGNFSHQIQHYSEQGTRYKGIVPQHWQHNILPGSSLYQPSENILSHNRNHNRLHGPRSKKHHPSNNILSNNKQQNFIPGSTCHQTTNNIPAKNGKFLPKKEADMDQKQNRQYNIDCSHPASHKRYEQEHSRPNEAIITSRPNHDINISPKKSRKSPLEKYEKHLKIRSVKNLIDSMTEDTNVKADCQKSEKHQQQATPSLNNVLGTPDRNVKSPIEKYEKHLKIKAVKNQESENIDVSKVKWTSDKGWKTPSNPYSCMKNTLNNENTLHQTSLSHQHEQYFQQNLSDYKDIYDSCNKNKKYSSLGSLEKFKGTSLETRHLSETNLSMFAAKLHKFKLAKSESKQVISPTWCSPVLSVKKVDNNKPSETCDTSLTCSGRSRPMVRSGKCYRELFRDKNDENLLKIPTGNIEKHKIDGIDTERFHKKQWTSLSMAEAAERHQLNIDKYLKKSFSATSKNKHSSSKNTLSYKKTNEKNAHVNITKEKNKSDKPYEKSTEDNSCKDKLGKSSNYKHPETLVQNSVIRTTPSKYRSLEIKSKKGSKSYINLKTDEKNYKYSTRRCQVIVKDINKGSGKPDDPTSKKRKRKSPQNSSSYEIACKFARIDSSYTEKNVVLKRSRKRNSNSKTYSDSETSQLVSVKLYDEPLSKSVRKLKNDRDISDKVVPVKRKRGRSTKNSNKDDIGSSVAETKSNIYHKQTESTGDDKEKCSNFVSTNQKQRKSSQSLKTSSSEDSKKDDTVIKKKRASQSEENKSDRSGQSLHLSSKSSEKDRDKEQKERMSKGKKSHKVNRRIKDKLKRKKKAGKVKVDKRNEELGEIENKKVEKDGNELCCGDDEKISENCLVALYKNISPAVDIENTLPESSNDKSSTKQNNSFSSQKSPRKHFLFSKKKVLKSKMKSIGSKLFKSSHKKPLPRSDDQKPVEKKPTIIVTNEKLVLGKIKTCPYCKKYHTRIGDLLKLHIQFDHPFKCFICRVTFEDKEEMFNHRRIHVKQYHYCKLCQREFRSERNYERHEKSSQHQMFIRVQRQLLENILDSYTKKDIPNLSEFSDLVTFPDMIFKNPSSIKSADSEKQAERIERFYHESSEIQDLLSIVETKIKVVADQKNNEKHSSYDATHNGNLKTTRCDKNTTKKADHPYSTTSENNDLDSAEIKKEVEKYVTDDVDNGIEVVECEELPSLYSNQFLVDNNEIQNWNNTFEHFDVNKLPPLVPRVVSTSFDKNSSVYKNCETNRYTGMCSYGAFDGEYEAGPCSFLYDDTMFGITSELTYNAFSDSYQSLTNSYIDLTPMKASTRTQIIDGMDQINDEHQQTKNSIDLDANRCSEMSSFEPPNMINSTSCDIKNRNSSTGDVLQSFAVHTSMEQIDYVDGSFTEMLTFTHETSMNDSMGNSLISWSNSNSLFPLSYQSNQLSIECVKDKNLPTAKLSSSKETEATQIKEEAGCIEKQDSIACRRNNIQDLIEEVPVAGPSETKENRKKIIEDQRNIVDNSHCTSCIKTDLPKTLSETTGQTSILEKNKVRTTVISSSSGLEKASSEHVLDSDVGNSCPTFVEETDTSVTKVDMKEKNAIIVEKKSDSLEGTSSDFATCGEKLLANLVIDLDACHNQADSCGDHLSSSDTSNVEKKSPVLIDNEPEKNNCELIGNSELVKNISSDAVGKDLSIRVLSRDSILSSTEKEHDCIKVHVISNNMKVSLSMNDNLQPCIESFSSELNSLNVTDQTIEQTNENTVQTEEDNIGSSTGINLSSLGKEPIQSVEESCANNTEGGHRKKDLQQSQKPCVTTENPNELISDSSHIREQSNVQ